MTHMKQKTKSICSIENCEKPVKASNMCSMHVTRVRKYNDPHKFNPKRGGGHNKLHDNCVMDDCNNKHLAKGFCSKHYRAFKAWLDKDRSVENRSKINPQIDRHGYVLLYMPEHPNASVSGNYAEHRLVMEQMLGRYLVKGENVHHKNGIRNDNRPENLELWSSRQPKGQRVEDKVEYALEILALYAPERLR